MLGGAAQGSSGEGVLQTGEGGPSRHPKAILAACSPAAAMEDTGCCKTLEPSRVSLLTPLLPQRLLPHD